MKRRRLVCDIAIRKLRVPRRLPVLLTSHQLSSLTALARASNAIRYLHPSDQAAAVDWDALVPFAVEQVLQTHDTTSLLLLLRDLFAPTAPTVTFHAGPDRSARFQLPRSGGTHLARWQRAGLGNEGSYVSHREGRDADSGLSGMQTLPVDFRMVRGCKRVQLAADVARHGVGEVAFFLTFGLGGMRTTDIERPVVFETRRVTIDSEVPADAVDLQVGVSVKGNSRITIQSLALVCDGGAPRTVDLNSKWQDWSDLDLFAWTLAQCDGRTAERRAPRARFRFDPRRDHRDCGARAGLRCVCPSQYG